MSERECVCELCGAAGEISGKPALCEDCEHVVRYADYDDVEAARLAEQVGHEPAASRKGEACGVCAEAPATDRGMCVVCARDYDEEQAFEAAHRKGEGG